MRSSRVILATLIISVSSGAAAQGRPAAGLPALANEFVFTTLTFSPSGATQNGLHRYADPRTGRMLLLDQMLDDFSPAELTRQRAFYQDFRRRLQRLPARGFDAQTQADYELLQNAIDFALYSIEQEQFYRWKPQMYSENLGSSTLRQHLARVRRQEHTSARSCRAPRESAAVPQSGDRKSERLQRHFPAGSDRIDRRSTRPRQNDGRRLRERNSIRSEVRESTTGGARCARQVLAIREGRAAEAGSARLADGKGEVRREVRLLPPGERDTQRSSPRRRRQHARHPAGNAQAVGAASQGMVPVTLTCESGERRLHQRSRRRSTREDRRRACESRLAGARR